MPPIVSTFFFIYLFIYLFLEFKKKKKKKKRVLVKWELSKKVEREGRVEGWCYFVYIIVNENLHDSSLLIYVVHIKSLPFHNFLAYLFLTISSQHSCTHLDMRITITFMLLN